MLSVEEFTAIRSVGFEPIGQVLGVSVHQGALAYGIRCGAYPGMPAYGDIRVVPPSPAYLRTARDNALSVYGPEILTAVADELNRRPRKTLGWRSPAHALAQVLSGPTDAVATTP